MNDESPPAVETGPTEPPSGLFKQLPQPCAEAVIERAVKFRRQASPNVKKTLNAQIRQKVRVNGFRNVDTAPAKQIAPAALAEIDRGAERLAGAVLSAWEESHRRLRDLVAERLDGKGVPILEASAKHASFEASLSEEEWRGLHDAVVDGRDDLDKQDVALMLSLVTGKVPMLDMPVESLRFQRWLEELERLPFGASEWRDADLFADRVLELRDERIQEFVHTHILELKDAVANVRDKFAEELRYLDIDMEAWFGEAKMRLRKQPEALSLLDRLGEQMQRYQPIRPQAAVREEENRRAGLRERCEQQILRTVEEWRELMSCTEDLPQPAEEVAEERAEYRSAPEGEQAERLSRELEELRKDLATVRESCEQLTADNARLAESKDGAQLEKAQLGEQIGELKSQLAQSRKTEQYWRQAYVDAKGGADVEAAEGEDAIRPPANVEEAIGRIQRAFPDEIVFALNGKSTKRCPFQKPDEVYASLAWLATEFYHLRPNPGPSPDFDRLIKEACPGWFYKPNQTETTMGMYSEWYRTTAEGKTFELANHIGKGNSFDPKNTIRIAFAWDEDKGRVVVGFVGVHQRNRQS